MKQVFYVIQKREFINSDNKIDIGVRLEKVILSSESEDYKNFCGSEDCESSWMWESYIDEFLPKLTKELEEEESNEGELWVYESVILWEEQYKMLSSLMNQEIVEREVKICEWI